MCLGAPFVMLLLVSASSADDTARVDYWITLLDANRPRLAIEIEAPAAAAAATELGFGEGWGGVSEAGADFVLTSVVDQAGRSLSWEAGDAHTWKVRTEEAQRVRARFEIGPTSHRGNPQGSDYYQPIVEPQLIHLLGGNALPWPTHLDRQTTRAISLEWKGFEQAGWALASSHGVGAGPLAITADADTFRHAVFVAGKFTVFERMALGSPVRVAVWGDDWGSSTSDFADQCARIVEIERAFFDDRDRPPFLITLIPIGTSDRRSSFLGGTGLLNSFALFLQPGARLDRGPDGGMSVTWLLAHEMFHEWNGSTIRLAQPERRGYWFSEGFTDFYARRLLARNGLLDEDEFVASWNRRLTEFATHPQRGASAARIEEAFWSDREVQSLPYVRGDLIALKVDYAIRNATQGEKSLDDLMRALVRQAREERREFTVDDLIAEIGRWSDARTAAEVRAVAVDGAELELSADTFGPDYQLLPTTAVQFELGFDFQRTRAAKAITGLVAGSAAERAGLHEGDALRGLSLSPGQPDSPVVISIVADAAGAAKEVRYLPQGKPCQSWRLERATRSTQAAQKAPQLILDVGAQGTIDDRHAHQPAMVYWQGDLYEFYDAVSNAGGPHPTNAVRGISVARSRPW